MKEFDKSSLNLRIKQLAKVRRAFHERLRLCLQQESKYFIFKFVKLM